MTPANRLAVSLLSLLLCSCHTSTKRPVIEDYAAWSAANPDGVWTAAAENAIASTPLSSLTPVDVGRFCPRYASLGSDMRTMFWVGLLAAMAKYESDFDPELVFIENTLDNKGDKVRSRGLLQISIESARQDRYACAVREANDLHDPGTNLACGARILATWVEADGAIAFGKQRLVGGAHYWSVLRGSNKNLARVGEITRRLAFCS